MQAMILAAGLGTRLRPYSAMRPKPLFPVLNRPLLLHIIDQLRQVGCTTIVVNAHHLADQIGGVLANEPGVFVQHEEEILGTGGGLRLAVDHFEDKPLLVVNGDIFHTIDLAGVVQTHLEHQRQGCPVTMVLHDYPRFNQVSIGTDDRIYSFGRQEVEHGRQRVAFTGVQVVEPEILYRIPAAGFHDIITCYEGLLRAGIPVQGMMASHHFWTDIGTPEAYLDLHRHLLTGKGGKKGSESDAGPFLVDPTASLAADVRLHDWVCIGPGAHIGEGVELSRVVVWDGARIAPGRRISDEIVAA